MSVADAMIHVDEQLNETERERIIESVRGIEGVVSPGFNPGKDHLLMVAFDPAATRSTDLLENVRRLGYHAELVGL